MDKQHNKIFYIVQAGVIAALYTVITFVFSPISYGPIQFRVAESLIVLAAVTHAGTPGLIVGCIVANILGPYGVVDAIFGAAATGLAGICSYKLREYDWLVPLPPVLINGLIIGVMLHYVYRIPNLFACISWVSIGELASCYVLGSILLGTLRKTGLDKKLNP